MSSKYASADCHLSDNSMTFIALWKVQGGVFQTERHSKNLILAMLACKGHLLAISWSNFDLAVSVVGIYC